MFHLFPMGADNPDMAPSRMWDTPMHGLGSRAASVVKEKNRLQGPSLRMEWLRAQAAPSCSLVQSTCSMPTRSCYSNWGSSPDCPCASPLPLPYFPSLSFLTLSSLALVPTSPPSFHCLAGRERPSVVAASAPPSSQGCFSLM